MSFSIISKSLGNFETNCVAVANSESKQLVLFDAPINVAEFLKEFAGYTLVALLLTHGHFDHTLGVSTLKPLQIFGHEGDKKLYSRPQVMSAWMTPEEVSALQSVPVTNWVKSGDKLNLAGLQIEVRHAPGHSPGSVVYYIPALSSAVTGDCIFQGSIGRTDLPGGSMDELMKSLNEQILTLPEDTKLYSGHGPITTVGEEKRSNSFLQAS